MTTATESVYTQIVRARQAVKVLREFLNEVLEPILRAKSKAVPEHPKYLLSRKRYIDRRDRFLEAIQTIEGELEGLPE